MKNKVVSVDRRSLLLAGTALVAASIDRIAKEGALFIDWYGEQSCTAGRAAFITGQSPIRTGLTKVGLPGADIGLHGEDMSVAEALKPLGYATGQFGKKASVVTFRGQRITSWPSTSWGLPI
jgi:arylsulfatase A-like enzyme